MSRCCVEPSRLGYGWGVYDERGDCLKWCFTRWGARSYAKGYVKRYPEPEIEPEWFGEEIQ